MNEQNECILGSHPDTIPSLRVSKALLNTILAECYLTNRGWLIKAYQMTG